MYLPFDRGWFCILLQYRNLVFESKQNKLKTNLNEDFLSRKNPVGLAQHYLLQTLFSLTCAAINLIYNFLVIIKSLVTNSFFLVCWLQAVARVLILSKRKVKLTSTSCYLERLLKSLREVTTSYFAIKTWFTSLVIIFFFYLSI